MDRSRSRAVAPRAAPARRRSARAGPADGGSGGAPEGLREYRRKRDFTLTPEPAGSAAASRGTGDLMFVIQKHAATRLHYDFRLELEGVLKSWAVPKGPSLDPTDKRLAMHVEDHPIEYGDFEGIIPKGEYGGGTVVLWDRGTWEPEGDPHKGYHGGNLKFSLDGEKLRGSWALVRIKGGRNPARRRAELAPDQGSRRGGAAGAELSIVDERPESVASGRTLEEIAAAADRVWHSNRFDGASEAGSGARAKAASRTPAPRRRGATAASGPPRPRRPARRRPPRAPRSTSPAPRRARSRDSCRPARHARRRGARGRRVAARDEVRRLPHPRSPRARTGRGC